MMSETDEVFADVFAVPDFWRTSKWLDQLPQDNATTFFKSQLNDLSVESKFGPVRFDSVKAQEEGFFKLPPLDDDTTSKIELNSESTQEEECACIQEGSEGDVWMGLDELPAKTPDLRTWDAFIRGEAPRRGPIFLTEAGSSVYDALLTSKDAPLGLRTSEGPVVEAKAYFDALLAVALGRESMLFFRTEDRRSFVPALPSMRISGYSTDVLQGLQKRSLMCGAQILQLRAFVQNAYYRNATRCGVAFTSALDDALQAIDQNAITQGPRLRSLLQVQATIKRISSVLAPFHRLASKLRPTTSDEAIITMVFEQASSVESGEAWLRDIMKQVLQRVSRPWIEFLEEWIGTRREEGLVLSVSNTGTSKGFVKVEAEKYVNDHGEEVEEVDFRLDMAKMPKFMPGDVAQTIFETGRNLRFIRSAHPKHPLVQPDVARISQPPEADWAFDWENILQLERRLVDYRERLLNTIGSLRTAEYDDSNSPRRLQDAGSERPNLGFFTLDEGSMEVQIMASIERFDAPVFQSTDENSLRHIIRNRFTSDDRSSAAQPRAEPHWSLLPVLSFSGIVTTQAQVVNRETLRLLFKDHNLREHLGLQRDYQLFGSGLFSSRLSHALFDPELERADRQAGVARQGGVMGLRLGGRDTWPPASSELRLALMGVLAESFDAEAWPDAEIQPSSRDSPDLPGDLSFAIRDLSEEEIDRCMNQDSLEALDFLRLSYKAPSELAFILTPMILMQYDRVFKLLLRVLRMEYITSQLWREVMTSGTEDELLYRFVRESRHFVTSISSYFLDIGVAHPWKAFERKLDGIQASLDERLAEQLESPEQLRELHSGVLSAIMTALFLRKRQQPVLKLLEDVFTIILDYAKARRLEQADDASEFYRKFKKNVQVFLTVCRGLTEKGRVGKTKGESTGFGMDGIGDESIVSQLLMKLDINGYYMKH